MVEEMTKVKKIAKKSCLLCSELERRMGRGFGLDMYIVKVANKEVVKLEEVAKVALVILVSLVNLV